ncbi:MAG: hypothetical protein KY475_21580 [Planctomycetes bacterium]|nr:hypothetical protein [Planctomycetota bacterium]
MAKGEQHREIDLYAARDAAGHIYHCSMFRRVPESYCRAYNRVLVSRKGAPLELVRLRCRIVEETPLDIGDLLLEDFGE